jgi:hypothetical protein
MKFFFLVILLIANIICYSQNENKATVILKNRSKLRGDFTLLNQDSFLLSINNIPIRFSFAKVDRVIMNDKDEDLKFKYTLKEKFSYNTRVSIIGNQEHGSFSFSQSFLYQAAKNFFVGIGVGIENYLQNASLNLFPITIDSKYYLKSQKTAPFLGIRTGYGLLAGKNNSPTILDTSRGGFHFNPTFGFRLSGNGVMTEIYGGIKIQKMNLEQRVGSSYTKTDLQANRVEGGLSFMF